MHYLTNYYKNLCEQLQDRINVLSKLLNEENDSEPQAQEEISDADWQKYINSIHDMPLEEAEAHGEIHLSGTVPLFVGDGYLTNINDNHGFTKFLTHPDHSNESVLEHMNFLLKVAHTRDHDGGVEKLSHFGNERQYAVFKFARQHYPTLAYAMAQVASKANKARLGDKRYGSQKIVPSSEPIQITPEHLDQINREHGVIKALPHGFINSRKNHLMDTDRAENHIESF